MSSGLEWLIDDCDVETFRSGGKGGQHQNRTESAVRLRHRATGLTAICREERSQLLNKRRAAEILLEKIRSRSRRKKPRIATRPTRASKRVKRESKERVSRKKRLRAKVIEE